eukprot:CFRG1923T1
MKDCRAEKDEDVDLSNELQYLLGGIFDNGYDHTRVLHTNDLGLPPMGYTPLYSQQHSSPNSSILSSFINNAPVYAVTQKSSADFGMNENLVRGVTRYSACDPVAIFDIGKLFVPGGQSNTSLARIGFPNHSANVVINSKNFVPFVIGTENYTQKFHQEKQKNKIVPCFYDIEAGQCYVLPAKIPKWCSGIQQNANLSAKNINILGNEGSLLCDPTNTGYLYADVKEQIREIQWINDTDFFLVASGNQMDCYRWSLQGIETALEGCELLASDMTLHTGDIRSIDVESSSHRLITGGFDGLLHILNLDHYSTASSTQTKTNNKMTNGCQLGTVLRKLRLPSVIGSVSLHTSNAGQTGALTTDDGDFMLIDARSPQLVVWKYPGRISEPGKPRTALYTHTMSKHNEKLAFLGYGDGSISMLDIRSGGGVITRPTDTVVKAIGDLSLSNSGVLCATGYGGVSFSLPATPLQEWQHASAYKSMTTTGTLGSTSGRWREVNGNSNFFSVDSSGFVSVFESPKW